MDAWGGKYPSRGTGATKRKGGSSDAPTPRRKVPQGQRRGGEAGLAGGDGAEGGLEAGTQTAEEEVVEGAFGDAGPEELGEGDAVGDDGKGFRQGFAKVLGGTGDADGKERAQGKAKGPGTVNAAGVEGGKVEGERQGMVEDGRHVDGLPGGEGGLEGDPAGTALDAGVGGGVLEVGEALEIGNPAAGIGIGGVGEEAVEEGECVGGGGRTDAKVSGPIPLPTKTEIVTILRAVHKYKDSREQFERRTHKRLIDIMNPTQKTVEALMNLELPAGVEIDIKL